MAYSCSDFTSDVIDNLIRLGLVNENEIEDDNPQAQASIVIRAIVSSALKQSGADAAQLFFDELLNSVESIGAIAETYGAPALAQLMFLQSAILKGTVIELYPDEAERLSFLLALPSGGRWWKHVSQLPANG
jgi:hypothetical protein